MKKTVLCYGDSNTHGYDPYTGLRYPYEKRWTTLLGQMLGGDYEVIAEGLNGRTTAYDKPDGDWKNGLKSLRVCLGSHKPVDCMIIMLGTNDCIIQLGLTPRQIADGMDALVEAVRNYTKELQEYVPEIIVTAPPAIRGDCKRSPFAFELDDCSCQKSQAIVPLYRDIAEKRSLTFVDASGTEVAKDCEHLTEEGHRQIAELFFRAVSELMERQTEEK